MQGAESFYQKVESQPRIHWKDVDKYQIQSPEIARGDASFVYLAVQGAKKVAVKAYTSQWMLDNEKIVETELAGFERLGKLGLSPALLRKPLRTKNNIYLIMELCNGGSLDLYVKHGRPFPPHVIKEVVWFLASALLQLHSAKILHREINPRHVLVHIDDLGKVSYKLIGMQFFKDLEKEHATSFVGTPEYIAPEATLDLDYSFSADIWSVGVTLYELSVGATSLKIDPNFRARVKAGHTPLFPEGCVVPGTLYDLICKCLVYDPAKRLTAAQILEHPFLTEEKIAPAIKPVQQPHVQFTHQPPAHVPSPPVFPEEHKHEQVVPHEEKKIEKKQPDVPMPVLPETELVKIISSDFSKYIDYTNSRKKSGELRLKSEKRTNLEPYALKSTAPASRGGFSEIYFCTHKETKEEYALKVVKTSKMTDVKIADLLLGEVEIMLSLKRCPFTIHIEDYFVYKNDLCLILEFCNGGDLDNYVRKLRRRKASFPLEELKLIAWNVACGLCEMHKLHMMHRDIKPKNILVIEDPKTKALIDVKLCDYGLSKKVAEHQELLGSTILGTFDYFAPELYEMMEKRMAGDITDTSYDYKVDVWSYGVLLYFTLYGKTPMEPPGSKISVMKHKKINFPETKDVPQSFIDLIKKCLTFDPLRRPSFKELLNDPFFTIVLLIQRPRLAPYVQGNLIGEAPSKKARVYQCQKDGQPYALKAIDTASVEKKRILAEIDTLAKLKNSDNVIRMEDYFAINDIVYIVMEYYEGGDLEKYINAREASKQFLSVEQQILVAYSVLNGLNDIHSHNMIHRDVHPKNILLTLDPETKSIKKAVVSDFGFARVLLDSESRSMIFSPYNSPELTFPEFGGVHNTKTDIWSYGMLLYFLLFGKHADKHPRNHSLQNMLKKGDIKYDESRPNVCPELLEIMKRCFVVKADLRPTAFELLKSKVFEKYVNKLLLQPVIVTNDNVI